MLAAQNLQDRGELQEAEEAYVRLLEDAPDDTRRRWVLFGLAELAEERGEIDLALTRYEALYEEEHVDRFGARSMLRVADVEATRGGDEAALPLWRRTIRRYPDEAAAEDALARIIAHHDAAGTHEALVDELHDHYEAVPGSFVGDNILLQMALTQDQELNRPNEALDTLRRLLDDYPDDESLADDALWEMAAIYRAHQRWEPALSLLERLTSDVDSSWYVGSYASDWVDDGIFELGRIHLIFLDDYEGAISYFERVITDHSASPYADDAGWYIVEARRLAGDERGQREALQRFLELFPESRHVDDARRRLSRGGAP